MGSPPGTGRPAPLQLYTEDLAVAISDSMLNLIVMPTEKCNFRCIYCYEDFETGKMKTSTITGLKNLLSVRVPNLTHLRLSWFGGEPLIALDIIESLSEHVLSLWEANPGLDYRADATTNAYLLTPDVFANLLRWNIRSYQVSFDGTAEYHNRKRILANGAPTFARLWDNLCAIKELEGDFAVTIRLHLDHDNRDDAPAFIERFKTDFGEDRRFTVYARELSQLANPLKHKLNVFGQDEAMEVLDTVRALGDEMGVPIRVPERKSHVCRAACYAAKLNSLVVRSNGRLSKCTVALYDPMNDIGVLNEDGTLTLDNVRLRKWVRGLASGDPIELGCPMLNIS